MSKVFQGVPTNITDRINELPEREFAVVYRAIRHTGDLVQEDFYPTFADKAQLERINSQKAKGGMARIVAEQTQTDDLEFYALSLFDDLSETRRIFWRREDTKRHFPQIAKGLTTLEKGVAAKLKEGNHIAYFLYDYTSIDGNPVTDFSVIPDEVKQNNEQ